MQMLPGVPSHHHLMVMEPLSWSASKQGESNERRESINYCDDLVMIKSSSLESDESEPNRDVLKNILKTGLISHLSELSSCAWSFYSDFPYHQPNH